MLSQSYQNLPANSRAVSAVQKLLDGDLEQRTLILGRYEEVQAQYTYAKKAAEVFADCLALTSAAKDAFAASILSTKALEEALKNILNFYDNHHDILATISSTKGMLATWAEMVALTEPLLTQLDKTTSQVEAHLHQAADERVAHEFAHIAASASMLSCTGSLRTVGQSIAQKKSVLFGIRRVPTEILSQIFTEAVDARQCEIITSLSSYHDTGDYHDISSLSTTLNLVPFTLSATCKRWRAICQSTPRLWRYARMPMVSYTRQGKKITGRSQLERCVRLARTQPLNLTVYPCYDVTHRGATYPGLALLVGSQILSVNIVWHSNYAIPRGVPSPFQLYIVASANSPTPYTQVLPADLLANTKVLCCTGLMPQINSAVGINAMHISLSKEGALPSLQNLLQNCPRLTELYLDIKARLAPNNSVIMPFTHQQLHSLWLTGMALPWIIVPFSVGCRLPRLTRFVLTDINGFDPAWRMWTISPTNGQFSHITHIEVQAVSAPSVLAHFRPLFEAATGLGTLALAGSAVGPMLKLITLSAPKRVDTLFLSNSNADGTTLLEYLAAIQRDGGDTSRMKVAWNNCPNFSGVASRACPGNWRIRAPGSENPRSPVSESA